MAGPSTCTAGCTHNMRHDTCVVVVIGSSTQTRGVVYVVNTMEDIDWLLQHGDNGAYIVAMEDIMFNK